MPENSTDEVNGTPLVQGQLTQEGQLRPEVSLSELIVEDQPHYNR